MNDDCMTVNPPLLNIVPPIPPLSNPFVNVIFLASQKNIIDLRLHQ